MPITGQFKICPRCGQATELSTPACLRCQHIFRTQFVPPTAPDPTAVVITAPRSRWQPRKEIFYYVAAGLAGLLLAVLIYHHFHAYPFLGTWKADSNSRMELSFFPMERPSLRE